MESSGEPARYILLLLDLKVRVSMSSPSHLPRLQKGKFGARKVNQVVGMLEGSLVALAAMEAARLG
jgi:hypothetical protein